MEMNVKYIQWFITNPLFSLLLIFLIAILILFKIRKKRNIAPGPKGTFLIGNTFLFKPRAYEKIDELSKQYGPIYEFSFCGQPVVVLGNYEIIKEAFLKYGEIFSGRPKAFVWETYSNSLGLSFNQGEIWARQKKFAFSVFRKFGLSKGNMEDKVNLEIDFACNFINEQKCKPFNPKRLFKQIASNIVQSIAFSKRIDYEESHKNLLAKFDQMFKELSMTNPVNFFSPLGYILKSFKEYKKNVGDLRKMMIDMIEEHEMTYDKNNIRDYIDAFLEKMYKDKKDGKMDTTFTRLQLAVTLTDFFLGGTETVSNTMLWAILYLLHYPEIQQMVQKEIDSVVGQARSPNMSDRINLPYTHATLMEVQRYASITPLAIAHATREDIKLMGYDIPKGAFILPNLTAVHFDPNYWKEPDKFDPKRFLDYNGLVKQNIESFLPFSIGNRNCVGEVIAKTELFLVFTSLLQRFSFKPSPNDHLPPINEKVEALILRPLPYSCCATRR